MAVEEKIKIFCGECGRNTNHMILVKRKVCADPDAPYHWVMEHYFCQCAGCDSYCYATAEWGEDYIGDIECQWKTYPQSESDRKPIDDIYNLPQKIRVIYQEIIGAVNAQLLVLTAIGLRALIEAICKDRGVKAKNLELLIDGLADNGILSISQASILHSHRFLGNVAAHEIKSAKSRELIAALEIAEAVLRTIYVLPRLSQQIKTGKEPQQG